jgi:hypothetical protein
MLKADVLNSDASLNSFKVINTLEYIPGSDFTLVVQLTQPQRDGLRYMTEAGATLTLHLPKKDGTSQDLTMTAMAGDSSIWSGDITSEQSADLASGNATFTLDEGGDKTLGWIENALALIITGGC